MNPKILFILALGLIVLLSGCTLPTQAPQPVCGNKVCEANETAQNCSTDCKQPSTDDGQITDGTDDGSDTDGAVTDGEENEPPAAICGNSICEASETSGNCSADCGQPSDDGAIDSGEVIDDGQTNGGTPETEIKCGNALCEAGETTANCPADCEQEIINSVCGDGVCNGNETYLTCDDDCTPPPVDSGTDYQSAENIGTIANVITLYVGSQNYADGDVTKTTKNTTSQQAISGTTDFEHRAFLDFDTSKIPENARVVKVVFAVYVNSVEGRPKNSIYRLSSKAFDLDTKTIWESASVCEGEAGNSCYFAKQNILPANGWNKIDLGAVASKDLQDLLAQNYFSIGISGPSEDPTGDVVNSDVKIATNDSSVNRPYLIVTYESDEWPPLSGTNILKNPDFETGYAYPWIKFDEDSKAKSVGIDNADWSQGKYSYKITNDVFSGETYILTQKFTASPSADYIFGGAIKSNLKQGSCQIDLFYRSGNGLDTSGISVSGITGWKYYAEQFTTPVGASEIELRLISAGSANGDCLFDDMYVAKVV